MELCAHIELDMLDSLHATAEKLDPTVGMLGEYSESISLRRYDIQLFT